MLYTPSRCRNGLAKFTHYLKVLSGPTPRVHQGKTQLWNRVGDNPRGWESLERAALAEDETAIVWRGSEELPTHQRGIKVLGTPLGHADFVQAHLDKLTAQILLDRIPLKTPRPLGCSWSIVRQQGPITLLGWSPHWLLNSFATHMTWGCGGVCAQSSRFPLSRRPTSEELHPCQGLRSALRVREPAYWSSWMDCLPTIHKRHPVVAHQLVDESEGQPTTPFLSAAAEAARNLTGTLGFDPPSWHAALHGARPRPRNP